MKVKTVGAFHNNFVMIDDKSRVFMNEALENEDDVKFYGN